MFAVYEIFMDRFSKSDLIEVYSFLHDQKVFNNSWSKKQIATAISRYLDKIGFKPFKCFCGTYFNSESEYYHHVTRCDVLERARNDPDHERRFDAYTHETHLLRNPKAEVQALEKSIQDKLPSCTNCGEKMRRLQSIENRNITVIKCRRCNTISILND